MNDFLLFERIDELDTESKALIEKAKSALPHAHAPYSHFRVGAALLLENGEVITGTNQENAAYPVCMCAERVALYAKASQYPDVKILKMAVIARPEDATELVPATSCGPCRQVMLEFEMRQHNPIEVIMQHNKGKWMKAPSAKSLLPFCFTSENLA